MSENQETHSIVLHLRRTIHEDAYVAVPVTDAILQKQEDGTATVDFEAFVAEAIRIGQSAGVDWQVEFSQTEAHPVQCPLPENRRSFDPFHQPHEDDE